MLRAGGAPQNICYNSTNDKVYCGNFSGRGISVIDGMTNNVAATVAIGSGINNLLCDPAGNRVYATNYAIGDVAVIDGATNTVVDSIVLGDDPTVLCFNPTSGKLYASGAFNDTVKVIDAATNDVIAEVRTGSDPRDLRYKEKFGDPDEWRGDPFQVIIAWKWTFRDARKHSISLILQHSMDDEQKLGNSVKLTDITLLDEERLCYEKKKAPETDQKKAGKISRKGRQEVTDFRRFIPQ